MGEEINRAKTVQGGSNDTEKSNASAYPLNPNVLQRRASNPSASVWVGASAGTGKTKVLTDRVLRLLLPRDNNEAGTPAHKILCLTFTKAAASEMALRINKTLAEWAVMDESALHAKLESLLGRSPRLDETEAARKLFAQVIDTPGGLKIMTLHSFCQSILGRFPLEAGIAPNFSILDENSAAELMAQAKTQTYAQAAMTPASPLSGALNTLAAVIGEDSFEKLLGELARERAQLRRILGHGWDIDGLYTRLCAALDIPSAVTPQDILHRACAEGAFDAADLREAGRIMLTRGGKTNQENGAILLAWLDRTPEGRMAGITAYYGVYFTQEGKPLSKLMDKKLGEDNPAALDALHRERARLEALKETRAKAASAALTRDLFLLGGEILKRYEHLKRAQGVLDFDDLIGLTTRLLGGDGGGSAEESNALDFMPSWVLYKLDQGLDHILIDEAQDTNPEQWAIIKALAEEFFAGIGARDGVTRTIFTVGDEKQSIYSFQRASPEEFDIMRGHFTRRIGQEAGLAWDDVALNISFRSTRSVLEAVDRVFAQPALSADPGFSGTSHSSYRSGQAGLVELWPLYESAGTAEDYDPWEPPVTITEGRSSASLCAEGVATTIQGWIERGERLESHDRPIEAGDIMILVRTRTAFVNQLIRALKTRGIPVSGHDRMVLNDQLAVQDLLALAEFALLPPDDLTLACLLKSPLIGMSEDALFDLAVNRPDTLWHALKNHKDHAESVAYLESFIAAAHHMHPYEFFSAALDRPCPADHHSGLRAMKKRLGHDALDPIDELLNAALRFEEDHTPSLQGFIRWQKSGHAQIKREMEESGGQVRIMTVHGSKGLQAPIVILPDTVRNTRAVPGQADKRLLWPHKTGLAVPLWSPRKDMDFAAFETAYAALEAKDDQEYRRLLYVAMTRAEERLYVTGYKGKREPMPDSWYEYIRAGLQNADGAQPLENGGLRLTNAREKNPDRQPATAPVAAKPQALPEWLFRKAPQEPSPPQPLVPSRPSQSEPAALSPLHAMSQSRFRRGNVTHKLLQFLPDIAPDLRQATAQKFLTRYAQDLGAATCTDIIRECLEILNDPEFAPLFGPGSRAEVPITGLMNGRDLVSGQIDRLFIRGRDIWIIDFKTNRPPPQDARDVPQIYKDQMRAYHDTLRAIYPNHTIHCGLIWTDGPRLMRIDVG